MTHAGTVSSDQDGRDSALCRATGSGLFWPWPADVLADIEQDKLRAAVARTLEKQRPNPPEVQQIINKNLHDLL